MKTAFCLLVASACCAASLGAISTPLATTFSDAAAAAADLGVEGYSSAFGASLKVNITSSVAAYLQLIQGDIDFYEANTVRAYTMPISNTAKGIEYEAANVNENTSFDSHLSNLIIVYRELVAVVNDGTAAATGARRLVKGVARRRRAPSGQWTPEQAYVQLADILREDLVTLRDWVVSLVDAGIDATIDTLPTVLKEYRQQNLLPVLTQTQRDANTLETRYGALFQQYSSPQVYADYQAAKQVLLDTQFVA